MTDAPRRIEVDYRHSDIPLESLIQHLQKLNSRGPLWHRVVKLVCWIGLVVALFALFQLVSSRRAAGPELVIVDFAAGVVVTLLTLVMLNQPTYRRTIAAIKDAPSRRQGIRIVLDDSGMTLIGTGLRIFQSWKTVVNVDVVDQTTLIMPSMGEFYAVPHFGLPADVTPEILSNRIDAWRKAAERTPWPDQPPFSSTVMESLPTPKVPPSFF